MMLIRAVARQGPEVTESFWEVHQPPPPNLEFAFIHVKVHLSSIFL